MTGETRAEVWLLEAVKYFRTLGFFAEDAALSDQELASQLKQRYLERVGEDFKPSDSLADLSLLALDDTRAWWNDAEADVFNGHEVYVRTLQAWGAISRGSFLPEDIEETWESEAGPVRLTFTHKGRRFKLNPEYLNDFLDLTILMPVNQLIADTGVQFEVYEPFDQTAFIVALTLSEKARLQTERGWRFGF